MASFVSFTAADARNLIAVPVAGDDKYTRGVLGVVTGSAEYPGAAVLSVDAALHTGVGMVRYLGPATASGLVLHRRPEAVTANGRVQAWLIGSGIDATNRDDQTDKRLTDAISSGLPVVIDAGALDLLPAVTGPAIITPHYRELSQLLAVDVAAIQTAPAEWAARAAQELSVTVLLKGHVSYIVGSDGTQFVAPAATSWLATAGAGDALGGILGALVATHASQIVIDSSLPAKLAAAACVIHGLAAGHASNGGPFTVLQLIRAVPRVIADVLARYP